MTVCTDDPTHVRHGYNLATLGDLTRTAVHGLGPMGMDWHDRYDVAWSAIAEAVCAAAEAPSPGDLVQAGRDALYAAVRATVSAHGHYVGGRDADRGFGSSPAFARYWTFPPVSFEAVVVERLALRAVMAALPDMARHVLATSAAVGPDLAPALGVPAKRAARWLREARSAALALWHDHETPRTVAPIRPRARSVAPCGTRAGYARHRYHREDACQPCRAANAAATAARWRATSPAEPTEADRG